MALSIRTTVIGSIAGVALLCQLVTGVLQYMERSESRRQDIQQNKAAALQMVVGLVTQGINKQNHQALSDPQAQAMLRTSGVLYVRATGGTLNQKGQDQDEPAGIEYEFLAHEADRGRLREIARSFDETGFVDGDEHLFVSKSSLKHAQGGGHLTAIFPAEALEGLELEVAQEVGLSTVWLLVVTSLIAFLIGKKITAPVYSLSVQLEQIAATLDISRQLQLSDRDVVLNAEAGATAAAFNSLLSKLHTTLKQVSVNVEQVSAAVTDLSGLSKEVSMSSNAQRTAAGSMAVSIEQMTNRLADIAENAARVNEASYTSGQLSKQGGETIGRASAEMTEISRTVAKASVSIQELGARSNDISAIVRVIKEIADQTNLLALNAAIEAARAGEAGRGFAVVADEVRKLAERTTLSTQQIGEMITAIQCSAGEAVETMGHAVDRVSEGVQLASAAGDAITQINDGASHVSQGVDDINAALQEQNASSAQVRIDVQTITHSTEENTTAAMRAAESVHRLESLALDTRSAIGAFKI